MSKLCVIGKGFLGTALKNKLEQQGHEVSWFPQENTEIVFYFGGVSHPNFDKNPEYWSVKETGDLTVLKNYCQTKKIKLIYASSALVYEPESKLGKFKKHIEEEMFTQKDYTYVSSFTSPLKTIQANTLGLRIFPVWGKGGHTVIEQFSDDIRNNRQPIIYGDGTQTRDFIYIDDAIDQIISVMGATGIVDIGVGNPISFNSIVAHYNKLYEKNIKPKYIKAPKDYQMKGVVCKYPLR